MASSGMLRRVALERTDVSEERSASFIRVTRIGELGTTLTVTSNVILYKVTRARVEGVPMLSHDVSYETDATSQSRAQMIPLTMI
jgi:hypothetical protein